ncbi:uncharacterized protein V1518DRAFT_422592 [Limtongia smithiae]|uniref:uncharacterized protein n=1 Tax=Limtongia smithiae TaxID=1125753 RepID=UPI0034D00DD1
MATQLSPADIAKLWCASDALRLRQLARQIDAHDAWRPYLSAAEHAVFTAALAEGEDVRVWKELISASAAAMRPPPTPPESQEVDEQGEGPATAADETAGAVRTPRASPPLPASTRISPAPDAATAPPDNTPHIPPVPIDYVALALKIRYMLYERSVDYIFAGPARPPAPAPYELDFSFLDDDDDEADNIIADVNKTADSPRKPATPPARKVDDDNYDDDDEDEEDEGEKEELVKEDPPVERPAVERPTSSDSVKVCNTPNGTPQPPRAPQPLADSDPKPPDGIITPADTPTATSDAKPQADDTMLIYELNSIYQTLDTDDRNSKYFKPSGSGHGAATKDDPMTVAATRTGKLSQVNLGAANLSLKHLLAVIDDKRQQLSFSDNELRNLISEVRKNRSKWASEERIGQEELYEAAEKVVLELRAYTEHSAAFLNKVNKRDAPNYFSVIKTPMDLGTVMKKLKAYQYRSKQEFVYDIMLIWNNCFEFNTDPNHYLRKHAAAMKKKTLALIPLMPDITIRTKAEAQADEAHRKRDMSVDVVDLDHEDAKGDGEKRELEEEEDKDALEGEFVYDVIPTMPEAPWNVSEKLEALRQEEHEIAVDLNSEYSPFLGPKGGLVKRVDANLARLQEIRKVCSKISVIKRMQQHSHLYASQLRGYNPAKLVEQDIDAESRLPGHSDMSKEVAEACLQRSVAKLAMHTGYEDVEMLALEGLTALAGDFMQRLGRTLCLYMESTRGARRYTMEDVILQTFFENGTYNLDDLETYVRDDIDRFGMKLKDMQERFSSSLADYLRPALSGDNADKQFDDGSQEFISGGFSDVIGEDFLGLKELGLDTEFGVSLKVALHLIQSRLQVNSSVQAAPVEESKLASAPPFEPLTRERVGKQIGLLQPFFMVRFEKFEGEHGALLEDEELPPKQRNQRPKLPPTGKITVIKKRSSDSAFQSSKKKKKT